nr:hypothetical protein BOSE7B_60598 [Bosea sp. 7B]
MRHQGAARGQMLLEPLLATLHEGAAARNRSICNCLGYIAQLISDDSGAAKWDFGCGSAGAIGLGKSGLVIHLAALSVFFAALTGRYHNVRLCRAETLPIKTLLIS